jgi:protein TonB
VAAATELQTGTRERLGSTLFFALVLHGVLILGITFGGLDLRGNTESSTLRVTVVVPGAPGTPADSDILAQVDSLGSGTPTRATDPAAPIPRTANPLDSPADQGADAESALPGRPQPDPDVLVSRDPAQRQAQALPDPTDRNRETPRLARPTEDLALPPTRLLTDDDRL